MNIKKFFISFSRDKYLLKNWKFWLNFFIYLFGFKLFLSFIIILNIKYGYADSSSINNHDIFEINSATNNSINENNNVDTVNGIDNTDISDNIEEEEENIFTWENWLWLKKKLQFLAIFGLESAHKKANDEWAFKDTRDWAGLAVFLWIVKWLYFLWYLFFK